MLHHQIISPNSFGSGCGHFRCKQRLQFLVYVNLSHTVLQMPTISNNRNPVYGMAHCFRMFYLHILIVHTKENHMICNDQSVIPAFISPSFFATCKYAVSLLHSSFEFIWLFATAGHTPKWPSQSETCFLNRWMQRNIQPHSEMDQRLKPKDHRFCSMCNINQPSKYWGTMEYPILTHTHLETNPAVKD